MPPVDFTKLLSGIPSSSYQTSYAEPANLINYFRKELVRTLDNPAFYETQPEEYWALDPSQTGIRAIPDLPVTLDSLEAWLKTSAVGMADEFDLYSDDVKLVEMGSYSRVNYPTMAFARAINWSWGELEQYRLAKQLNAVIDSFDLIDEKLRILGEYFNKRQHHTILYGFPPRGLYGLLSQPGVRKYDAIFKPYAQTNNIYQLSARDLVADLIRIVYSFAETFRASNLGQIKLTIPGALFTRLAEPYADPAGHYMGTVRSQLADAGITNITARNELKGENLAKYVAGDAKGGMYDPAFDRIVIQLASYAPEMHYFPRKIFAPFQTKTLKTEQVSIWATTGLIIRKPNAFGYYDFNNTLVAA